MGFAGGTPPTKGFGVVDADVFNVIDMEHRVLGHCFR